MKRIILIISALLILLPSVCAASSANVPYQSYTYDYRKNVILTPHPYLPQSNVSGETLGISAFRKANDLAVANDGRLFVADTGNNRVVVVSADFKRAEYIIDTIMNGGVSQKLNAPSGVTVSESGEIYIADSGNRRVVVLMRDMRTVARV
ncbi:MAG: gluconolactonase, partial [Oscillospiraceae bacterium]|nr:gluconolactonase [Oscillospiraceae bacterium]